MLHSIRSVKLYFPLRKRESSDWNCPPSPGGGLPWKYENHYKSSQDQFMLLNTNRTWQWNKLIMLKAIEFSLKQLDNKIKGDTYSMSVSWELPSINIRI